ncbi:MAG: DUF1624 domain-containing protein [Sphingomonadales bacterium]|nr:DUF1624 domain-containing protein [Sphingomonadales bacterium]
MTTPARSLAVDAMRGLTIVGMILVNMAIDPARSYATLLHSVWNGFTLADAIYPAFLFVMGTALALTVDRADRPPSGRGRVLRRVALLIGFGLVVSNAPFGRLDDAGNWHWQALENLRFPGVLQRIALAYLLGLGVVRAGGWRAALGFTVAVLPLWWWLALACGDLTLPGSAALKTDLAAFGPNHLYQGEGRPFDPEGLFGTIPATANLLAGYLACCLLPRVPLPALIGGGLALVALALLWSQGLPLNKKLWSSSYALLNLGLDTALLATLAWLIDRRGWRYGTGFLAVFGRNPLALYVLAEILMALAWTFRAAGQPIFLWLYDHAFAGASTGRIGSLAFGLAMVLLCWLIGRELDRRGWYLRA